MKNYFDCCTSKKGCKHSKKVKQKTYLVYLKKNSKVRKYNICNKYYIQNKNKFFKIEILKIKCLKCKKLCSFLYSCGNCELCCTHITCDMSKCNICSVDNKNKICPICLTCTAHCKCEFCKECGIHNYDSDICDTCNYCEKCCSCNIKCRACKFTRAHDYCDNCYSCVKCCRCKKCRRCSKRIPNYGRSGQSVLIEICLKCSNSRLEGNIMPVTSDDLISGTAKCSGAPKTAEKASNRKLFDCKRLVGVEWEYNNVNNLKQLVDWTNKWGAGNHHDGSCGREVVTPPIAGDHIVNCLSELGEAFSKGNSSIDHRCAIHVHVDAGDYNWSDMYRLLKVYSIVEPLLYAIAGHQRTSNRYCIPCGSSYALALKQDDKKGAVLAVAYGSQDGRRSRWQSISKKDGNRYRGLNIVPWIAGRAQRKNKKPAKSDTTVEFRIHKNTSKADQVIGWTKLCARLVDWSYKASDAEVAALPKSPTRILTKIIAPDLSSWILDCIKKWREENKLEKYISYERGRYDIINNSSYLGSDITRAALDANANNE